MRKKYIAVAVTLAVMLSGCSEVESSSEEQATSTVAITAYTSPESTKTTTTTISDPDSTDSTEPVTSQGNVIFEVQPHFISEKSASYEAFAQQYPDYTAEQVITYVNIGLDRDYYTDVQAIANPDDLLVLVNKYNYLGEDYEPSDLTLLPSDICTPERSLYLRAEASSAFVEMANTAKAEGYTIWAHSTYRSYSYQKQLYDNYVSYDGQANADTYSARAGYSEHQTGLAVDVRNNTSNYNAFGSTEEYQWMLDNSYKFGYILHYIPGTQWITGYQTEEWHFRYVGVETAEKIHNLGITFDEYCARYLVK